MSVNYILKISTALDCEALMNDVSDEFNFKTYQDISSYSAYDGKGLCMTFVDFDDEDKYYAMLEFGPSLNKMIIFTFRANDADWIERHKLIFKVIIYILNKISGDVFFVDIHNIAYLERRNGVLAIDPETFEYFPYFENTIESQYIIKNIEVMELPDDDLYGHLD